MDTGGGTVEWIVFEGLIRRGVINVLWAPKGYAKSTLAGHLGSIVTGSASFPDRDTIPEALPILIYATEENRTIWEQRLRLMGGDPKLMAHTTRREAVVAALEDENPPSLIIIDPLQDYLGNLAYHPAAGRAQMKELQALIERKRLTVLALTHARKDKAKALGTVELENFARVIHRIEKLGGDHFALIRGGNSSSAIPECLKYHTVGQSKHGLAKLVWDTEGWVRWGADPTTDTEAIDKFIADIAGVPAKSLHTSPSVQPISVDTLVNDTKKHGWIVYRKHIVSRLKEMGWESKKSGRRGILLNGQQHYWFPPTVKWQWSSDAHDFVACHPELNVWMYPWEHGEPPLTEPLRPDGNDEFSRLTEDGVWVKRMKRLKVEVPKLDKKGKPITDKGGEPEMVTMV
ncbi:MAG TPA: AAA family ATPase [Hyphomicrobiaceae bacterium]|nr:AAA family ATPase [Hyphomicrobiaceae bacterium]